MTDVASLLLLAALAGFFGAAPAALLGRRVGYGLSLVASLLLMAAAIAALAQGPFTAVSWGGVLGETESLRLDRLSGFFALSAGIVWAGTSAFSLWYDERNSPRLAISYALTLGSIALLMSSTDFLLFLAGWELMTLSAYWMILEATGRPARIFSAAFVFLAFGEASTLLISIAIAGLRSSSGTFAMAAVTGLGPLTSLVFVVALVGFGLKMGVAPFHMSEWLPIAHSSAPSNASAVLSSTLTLAGVYGLFRFLLILPPGPAWWGALILSIGAISALLGALFASVSEHTKGLPAYSTIENNGLILVALGVAMIARSDGLTTLFAFAMFAAFFQAFAHAITKATLFLFAGFVEHTTGTFDLSSVQGQIKGTDSAASASALVSALSLAAAPPLAGFVSEWMILECLFQSYRFNTPELQFIGLLAGAAVALAAGLTLVAMVKFIGFAALWKPFRRTPVARPRGLGVVLGALSAVVVAVGVGAPWILGFFAPAVSQFAGQPVAAPVSGLLAIPNGWSIVSGAPFGILSPPAVPIGLLIGALAGAGYFALGGAKRVRRSPIWTSGRAPLSSSEVYTSFGFSTGLRIMLRSILGTREVRREAGPATVVTMETPEAYDVELEVLDVFKIFYDDLVRVGLALSDALKSAIMPGRLGRYLAYLLVVVLVVVVYTSAAFG
jgi:hydrogenase-4 component B